MSDIHLNTQNTSTLDPQSISHTASVNQIEQGQAVISNADSQSVSPINSDSIATTAISPQNSSVVAKSLNASAQVKNEIATLLANPHTSLQDLESLYKKYTVDDRAFIDIAISSFISLKAGNIVANHHDLSTNLQKLSEKFLEIANSSDLIDLHNLNQEIHVIFKTCNNSPTLSAEEKFSLNQLANFFDKVCSNKEILVNVLKHNQELVSQNDGSAKPQDYVDLSSLKTQGNFDLPALLNLEESFTQLEESRAHRESLVEHFKQQISQFDLNSDNIASLAKKAQGDAVLEALLNNLSLANKNEILSNINTIVNDDKLSKEQKSLKLVHIALDLERTFLESDVTLVKESIIESLKNINNLQTSALSVEMLSSLSFADILKLLSVLGQCGELDLGTGPIKNDQNFLNLLKEAISDNNAQATLNLFKSFGLNNNNLDTLDKLSSVLSMQNIQGSEDINYALHNLNILKQTSLDININELTSENLLQLASNFENSTNAELRNISPVLANSAFMLFKIENGIKASTSINQNSDFMAKLASLNQNLHTYIQDNTSGLPKDLSTQALATAKHTQLLLANETLRESLLSLDPNHIRNANDIRATKALEAHLSLNAQSHSLTRETLTQAVQNAARENISILEKDRPKYSQESVRNFLRSDFNQTITALNQQDYLTSLVNNQQSFEALLQISENIQGETCAYRLLSLAENTIKTAEDMHDNALSDLNLNRNNLTCESLANAIFELCKKPMADTEIRALTKSYIKLSGVDEKQALSNLKTILSEKYQSLSPLERLKIPGFDNFDKINDAEGYQLNISRGLALALITGELNLNDVKPLLNKETFDELQQFVKKAKDDANKAKTPAVFNGNFDNLVASFEGVNITQLDDFVSDYILKSIKKLSKKRLKTLNLNQDDPKFESINNLLSSYAKAKTYDEKVRIKHSIALLLTENATALDHSKVHLMLKKHEKEKELAAVSAFEYACGKATNKKVDYILGSQLKNALLPYVNTVSKMAFEDEIIGEYQSKMFNLFKKMHNDNNFADTVLAVAVFNAMTAMNIESIKNFTSALKQEGNFEKALTSMKDAMLELGIPLEISDDLCKAFLSDKTLSIKLFAIAFKESLNNFAAWTNNISTYTQANKPILVERYRLQVQDMLEKLDINSGFALARDLSIKVYSAGDDAANVNVSLGTDSAFSVKKDSGGYHLSINSEIYAKAQAEIDLAAVNFKASTKLAGSSNLELSFNSADNASEFIAKLMFLTKEEFNFNQALDVSAHLGISAEAEAEASVTLVEISNEDLNLSLSAGASVSVAGGIQCTKGASLTHNITSYDLNANASISASINLEFDGEAISDKLTDNSIVDIGKKAVQSSQIGTNVLEGVTEEVSSHVQEQIDSLNEEINTRVPSEVSSSVSHRNHIEVHNDKFNNDALISITSNITLSAPLKSQDITGLLLSYGIPLVKAQNLCAEILKDDLNNIREIVITREAILTEAQRTENPHPSLVDLYKYDYMPNLITLNYHDTEILNKTTSVAIGSDSKSVNATQYREIAIA